MYYDFKRDLAYSEQSVFDVIDILTEKGQSVEYIGKTSDYDILSMYKDRAFTYEDKDDIIKNILNSETRDIINFKNFTDKEFNIKVKITNYL